MQNKQYALTAYIPTALLLWFYMGYFAENPVLMVAEFNSVVCLTNYSYM